MQQQIGVRNNLWARQQDGLYAPKRRNFPIDSLELYLPLWHPELSGSPIISKDLNALSCTIVGSVHNPPIGRVCDGDDYIVTPASAVFTFGTGDFSIIVWTKITDTTSTQSIVRLSYNTGVTADYISAGIYVATDIVYAHSRTSTGGSKLATNAVSDNTWYCFGLSRISETVYGYINGVAMSTTAVAGANFDYSSTGKVYMLASDNDAGGAENYIIGTVGEGWIWSKGLLLRGQKQVYLATRWRYR